MSYVGQNGTRFIKSNGMDNKFEYNFLIICVDLNLNKKTEQIENSQVVTTFKFKTDKVEKKYIIFIKRYMKWDPFVCLKGK